jgi:glyoxylase-like metal-dependent hydrolase (beta-lactamase superfamily II)
MTKHPYRLAGAVPAQVAENLYRLPAGPGVNAYLWLPSGPAADDAGPLLFDCGLPWSGRVLAARLEALGGPPERLRGIAVTHDDIDHVGRLAPLQAVSGARVYAHAIEAARLAGPSWRRPPPLQGAVGALARALDIVYQRVPRHAVRVTDPLQDGDPVRGGWVAVHTPGHTPGHTSYFHQARSIVIAGDALGTAANGRLRFPILLYTEDAAQLAPSIRKLAGLRPSILCAGHGPVVYDAAGILERFAASLPVH